MEQAAEESNFALSDAAAPPRLGPVASAWRWFEMVALYFGLPAVLAAMIDPYGVVQPRAERAGLGWLYGLPFPPARLLMPTLFVTTVVIVFALLLDKNFSKRSLWNWGALRRELPRLLSIMVIGLPAMLAIAWALSAFTGLMDVRTPDGVERSAFLALPKYAPWILVIIGVFYPWLSAYPQEITHRVFFFHRYAPILRQKRVLLGVNVLAFMWLHAPFWNLLALGMTLAGGVLFAWTYERSRSTLAAAFEHAVWGWWAFATGLGFFVYAGGIGAG